MAAMKRSLDYYQANFSPYQFRQARIIEFPGYATFAQAFANTIPFSEDLGFTADPNKPDKIDFATYVTAHEMAHQWWAHQIVGADMQGGTVLSETLAQYSALLVMEQTYGPEGIRKFLRNELDAYLAARGGQAVEETPLIRVENQGYIHYRKGSLVMYLLRDQIGEAKVNTALRSLLARYAFKGAPYPTSRDLVDALRREAGDDPRAQDLITDLFEKITLYDLKTEEAQARRRPDGRYDVTLKITARKLYADGKGVETAAPLGTETFDLGVFTAEPGKSGFSRASVQSFTVRTFKDGEQTVTVTVDGKPASPCPHPTCRKPRSSDPCPPRRPTPAIGPACAIARAMAGLAPCRTTSFSSSCSSGPCPGGTSSLWPRPCWPASAPSPACSARRWRTWSGCAAWASRRRWTSSSPTRPPCASVASPSPAAP